MADTATDRLGARQQSQGSNLNSWGDDKLNEVLRLIDRAMHGVQALALTGDTTLSWTNYVATNDGQCAWLTLTGSLSSAASLTVPSRQWAWKGIKNSTGQTITVKTAAGSGAAIPNGRQIAIYCDGSDCYFGGGNYIGADITEVNNRDLMDKAAVEQAIANAVLPAAAGTVLVSIADTTAGYLGTKVNVTGSGAATVTQSIVNPGANEVSTFAIAVGALGLTLQTMQTSNFTAVAGRLYPVDTSTVTEIDLPAAATLGDSIGFAFGGTSSVLLDPNGLRINGLTSAFSADGDQTLVITYWGATRGWV